MCITWPANSDLSKTESVCLHSRNLLVKRRQNSNQCSKGAISRSFIFANFVVKMVPSRQNWILTWVIEVHFFDKTNGLGAIRFLVLAAKPLVLSKNLTSQTPIKIQFCVLDTIFESKKSKITCIDTILGMWKFTQNLPYAWKSFYGSSIEALRRQ